MLVSVCSFPALHGSTLQEHTAAAFSEYASTVEKELDQRSAGSMPFLHATNSSEDKDRLVQGKTIIENLNKKNKTPDGIIHDWVGTIFIPGVTLPDLMATLIDYDSHKFVFDEVIESELIEISGNHLKSYLRYKKKEIITVVTDTWYEAFYTYYPGPKAHLISRSTRINEVENFGKANERLKPEGEDNGFLWRMNTYWSLEETGDGVLVECRSVSLSRDIPPGLGLMIKPIITKTPRNSLEKTLHTLRDAAVKKRKNTAARDSE